MAFDLFITAIVREQAAVKWNDEKIQVLEAQVCDALILIQFCIIVICFLFE